MEHDQRSRVSVIVPSHNRCSSLKRTLDGLEQNQQVIYRYCDASGKITDAVNPNGAERNIAGICNAERNVFGMMPHPERASSADLGNTDGKIILEALLSN